MAGKNHRELIEGIILVYLLAGVLLIVTGWFGIYWLVPAIALSFNKAIYDAWVFLIIVNR